MDRLSRVDAGNRAYIPCQKGNIRQCGEKLWFLRGSPSSGCARCVLFPLLHLIPLPCCFCCAALRCVVLCCAVPQIVSSYATISFLPACLPACQLYDLLIAMRPFMSSCLHLAVLRSALSACMTMAGANAAAGNANHERLIIHSVPST